MIEDNYYPEVKRTPIYINHSTVAMITLFHKGDDFIGDSWAWDWENPHQTAEDAAKQIVDALDEGGHVSRRFWMALRDAASKKIEEDLKISNNPLDNSKEE